MAAVKGNRRRELFVQALAEGVELKEAAAAAGYSLAYARRLKQQLEAAAAPVAGREEVLSFLTDLLRATAEGGEAGVKERLKAAELLGKGNGAFQPQQTENQLHIEIEVVD